jgi:maltose alpha-D-glucosyltransferase/alpha-amylase
LRERARRPALAQWAHFLRNHDELDLGRLEPEQRQLVFERFAPEPGMRLYDRGIRRRLAPLLGGDRRRIELAYSLLFSLPGTPVLQYGDELGMGDDLRLKERAAVRTPMQWSAGPNGGFSTAAKPIRPSISSGLYGYESVNVEQQRRDPSSLLFWMTRMIRLRKECPEVGWGDWKLVSTRSPHILGIQYAWRGNKLLCLHNLAPEAEQVTVRIDGDRLADLLSDDQLQPQGGAFRVELNAYSYRWYRVDRPSRR